MGIYVRGKVPYTGGGSGETGYETDPTLSIEGMAADAKAVGDTKVSYTDIVDNLESTATKLPLSANMGRVLNEKINLLESNLSNIMPVTSEYGTVTGGYIKIGKQVSINIKLNITKNITSNVSDVIKGLPHVLNSYTGIGCFNVNTGVNLDAYIVSGTIRIKTDSVYIASGQAVTISGLYFAV